MSTGIFKANDKYRAQLRSTWVADPPDTTLQVTNLPANVPTIVTVGWNTDYETIFSVEGKSGDSPLNYTLTGVTRLRGANMNLPDNISVNCLNHEDFFNQYLAVVNDNFIKLKDQNDIPDTPESGKTLFFLKDGQAFTIDDTGNVTVITQEIIDDPTFDTASFALATSQSIKSYLNNQVVIDTSATPTPTGDRKRNELYVTAQAGTATFGAPTGTPANGNVLIIRIKDNGTSRTLNYNAIYDGLFDTLPNKTTAGKYLYIGFSYNSVANKWQMLAYQNEE